MRQLFGAHMDWLYIITHLECERTFNAHTHTFAFLILFNFFFNFFFFCNSSCAPECFYVSCSPSTKTHSHTHTIRWCAVVAPMHLSTNGNKQQRPNIRARVCVWVIIQTHERLFLFSFGFFLSSLQLCLLLLLFIRLSEFSIHFSSCCSSSYIVCVWAVVHVCV